MILKAVAGPEHAGMRLDDGAKALFPQFSKARIRRVIDWGGCRVSRSVVRVASRPLRQGDEITLAVTDRESFAEWTVSEGNLLVDEPEYLAVNKPAGVYSQRTPYQWKGTVEYAVGRYLESKGLGEPARVIHRLDRGTSGVMIFPKTRRAAAHISGRLMEAQVEKAYWALVPGNPEKARWTVDAPVASLGKSRFGVAPGGREARTAFRVLSAGNGGTLIEARPFTGRTHQVRVHLVHCGFPILGDDRYGGAPAPRMMLHCRHMAFRAEDGRRIAATAPLDPLFREACAHAGVVMEPRS